MHQENLDTTAENRISPISDSWLTVKTHSNYQQTATGKMSLWFSCPGTAPVPELLPRAAGLGFLTVSGGDRAGWSPGAPSIQTHPDSRECPPEQNPGPPPAHRATHSQPSPDEAVPHHSPEQSGTSSPRPQATLGSCPSSCARQTCCGDSRLPAALPSCSAVSGVAFPQPRPAPAQQRAAPGSTD